MHKRATKLQVYFNDDELKHIDDWRFEYKMSSRSAAIRALIGRGLFGPGPAAGVLPSENAELFADSRRKV